MKSTKIQGEDPRIRGEGRPHFWVEGGSLCAEMMTPQQRWLLDTQGFLHLRAAVVGDELAAAQRAADSYISAHGREWEEMGGK